MTENNSLADIAAGRLDPAAYATNFADLVPPLNAREAAVESSRCHYCYDAPCVDACPTGIDIPGFIRKIASGNVDGAGVRILEANIFGASCARVCPTEVLCEQACVRNDAEEKPVVIGRLQRYATDGLLASGQQPFARAPLTGKKVAVVGGGPSGIACAHRLAMLGHDVTVYETRPHAGGLNEYGIAEYKLPDHFARKELNFILSIGGITIKTGCTIGRDVTLSALRQQYDAVFLGLGLSGVRALGVDGEALEGVENAVDFIARLRQSDNRAKLTIGRRVVVIGGGNTAIDAAIQSKRLGAVEVTLAYRRGPAEMGATHHEQELAQTNGVLIRHWLKPVRLVGAGGKLAAVEFESTDRNSTGRRESITADQCFKAIGQVFIADPVKDGGRDLLTLKDGRIVVDDDRKTSLDKVWAGGDCVLGGQDLTVAAVEDGKCAAIAIDRALRG